MTDDLASLSQPPFAKALDALEDLMSQSGRAFLLGAGCGKCAGLPLTSELTAKVLADDSLSKQSTAILTALQALFTGAKVATVEDFMSELVDHIAIADRRAERGAEQRTVLIAGKEYAVDTLRNALEEMKTSIAKCIDSQDIEVAHHWKFVSTVHRALRSGKSGVRPVDYFILNYDTLIEDALALECLPFTDGFRGAATGWWDSSCYDAGGYAARVFKLHGSIDWRELQNDPLPRRIRKGIKVSAEENSHVLIWPASTKYRETQKDPYAQMLETVRRSLRPSRNAELVVAVCGYGFGDSHINLELEQALHESGRALTLIAFTEQESPEGQLRHWREDQETRDQVIICGRRGYFHGDKEEVSTVDLAWWKFEVLTRLLGGSR